MTRNSPSPAAVLVALLALLPLPAGAVERSADMVPGIGDSIPSPGADQIAPRRRLAQAAPERDLPAGIEVSPADATPGASGPVAAHGAVDAAKPGVPAAEASGGDAAGAPKSDERLGAERAAGSEIAPNTAEIEMVRVPAPIVRAARRALPGVTFKSVDLSRSGPTTVYSLSGMSHAQRAVSVAIDQSGAVLRVDREVREAEVPAELSALANAMLGDAAVTRRMLSLRPDFVAVYSFTGTGSSTGTDGGAFVLDVRADGRSLAFVDPE